ncbi:MAG: ACT domain-containing protein [Bacteroidota bacterium]
MSSGETNLNTLIRQMEPQLMEGDYVFCVADEDTHITPSTTLGMFHEKEGLTLILHKRQADLLGLSYYAIMKWISLTVHSSLEAVGLTAAISNALARANISCNVVAAYFHDHIFIPEGDEEDAMAVLRSLVEGGVNSE